jgi:hypothetical protein
MKTRSLFDQLMAGVGTARPREGALGLPTRQEDPQEDFADSGQASERMEKTVKAGEAPEGGVDTKYEGI